jgi:WD40 repeat protein
VHLGNREQLQLNLEDCAMWFHRAIATDFRLAVLGILLFTWPTGATSAEQVASKSAKPQADKKSAGPELVVQLGHSGVVLSCTFSPDGKKVLTSGGSGEVILWDRLTGNEICRFKGHAAAVNTAVFSPDGRQVLTASGDKTARLWDAASQQEIRRFEGHSKAVLSAALSPDGRQILTGGADETARLWDAAIGREVRRFKGYSHHVTSVAFSPDGRQILTGDDYGKVAQLWDAATGKELRRFQGHSIGFVASVAFSPDGKWILSGATDKAALVWDAATGKELRRFQGHAGRLCCVAFSPDVRQVLTGSADKTARLWDIATGKEVRRFEGHAESVESVAFSPDGRQILTASGDKTARLWDANTGREIHRFDGCAENVSSAAFFAEGRKALTASGDKTARLWDLTTGKELRRFRGHTNRLCCVAFSPDGRQVLTGSADQTARLWDAVTGKELRRFEGHAGWIHSVAFLPDGKRVITGSNDHSARLWDAATGHEIHKFVGHADSVLAVAVSADGRHVLTASGQGRFANPGGPSVSPGSMVRLWELNTGKELRHFEGHSSFIRSMVFSPDGRQILTGSDDKTARLWDPATGKELRRFNGHNDAVCCVGFSPDGHQIITASDDKTVRLWDAATSNEICRFAGSSGAKAAAFSTDGSSVFTGYYGGALGIWDVQSRQERGRIILLNRDQEWLAVAPEGYFDGSLDARQSVTWRIGNQVYPLGLYEAKFCRPDLITQALRGESIDDQQRVPADRTPPQVTIEVESTLERSATVQVTARPGAENGTVVSIRITVDGRDLSPERTRDLVRKKFEGHAVVYRTVVDFPPGKQEAVVAAVATDDVGLQSPVASTRIQRSAPAEAIPSTLYVLAVGVSRYKFADYNLAFPHVDAQELAKTLADQKGRAFSDVQTRALVNEEATAPAVKKGLEWLAQSCGPADVAVVLFAGHGVCGQRGLYYVTHEGDLDALQATCVNWKEVAELLGKVHAKQVIFLADCCHAGAFADRSASTDELAKPLVDAGVVVFTASKGSELSAESKEWGHGAFVYALLEGLQGKADLMKDGNVTVGALQAYVTVRVKELTDDHQHPQIPVAGNFDLGLVLARMR